METNTALALTATEIDALWESPIARNIDRLQDAGHNVYILGFSTDGQYAMVVRSGETYIAPITTANGIGRFEVRYNELTARHHAIFSIR